MKNLGFEILPHTVDTKMRVWGKKLEELFRNALRGVAYYLKPAPLDLAGKIKQKVKVEAADISSLLVEFLSEVVAQSDTHNAIFTKVTFRKFGDNFLEGVLTGAKIDGFDKEIKAVSYQEVNIKKNPETGLYETILVFDI